MPETWTLEVEAERLSITPRKLRELVRLHKPPVIRAGRQVLFDEIAHDGLIDALRVPTSTRSARTDSGGPHISAHESARAKEYKRALAAIKKARALAAGKGK